MPRPPKEKIKVLRKEKRTIKFKDKSGKEIEQVVEVKIYETKKVTQDDSLATQILNSGRIMADDEKDEN